MGRALQAIRLRLRNRLRLATTVGYGPRYLHSTGQYHKGGPNTGLFLQLTAGHPEDVPIPDAPYTFGSLEQAQALGDLQALKEHGRRALRIHLGADALLGLDKLEGIIQEISRPQAAKKSAPKRKSKPAARRVKSHAGKSQPKPAARRRGKPTAKKTKMKSKR